MLYNNNKIVIILVVLMYHRSIGSGLGIGRYSKSNDSEAKNPDRHISNTFTFHLCLFPMLYLCISNVVDRMLIDMMHSCTTAVRLRVKIRTFQICLLVFH